MDMLKELSKLSCVWTYFVKSYNYVRALGFFFKFAICENVLLLSSVVYVCLDGLVGVCISRGRSNGVI